MSAILLGLFKEFRWCWCVTSCIPHRKAIGVLLAIGLPAASHAAKVEIGDEYAPGEPYATVNAGNGSWGNPWNFPVTASVAAQSPYTLRTVKEYPHLVTVNGTVATYQGNGVWSWGSATATFQGADGYEKLDPAWFQSPPSDINWSLAYPYVSLGTIQPGQTRSWSLVWQWQNMPSMSSASWASSEIADAVRIRPIISQITSRSGGGPCTSCCGIDHRQPILNADGSRFVFSSIWNVDDYAGNLNPERNRELSTFLIASNKFQQLTITTNGMSLPYSFQGSKIGFVSCSPQFASSGTTNTDVFGYDLPSQTVTQWVNTVGIAAVQLGTNCPNAWFAASDWTSLANLHVDLSTDLRHLVWTSSRNLPSLGYPGGSNADGNYEIYWKDLASGEVRQLTGTTGGDNVSTAAGANLWPRTSGDGSKIVFVSNRSLGGPTISSNRYGLFLADANGGVQRLTAAEIQVSREFPAFGMDSAGSRVVFASDADLIGLNTNHTRQVFALDLSSSNLTQITRSGLGVTNSRPILSGDGLKVAFLSNGNLNGSASGNVEQLWVYHFDTDLAYTAPFVQVTSLSANQAATGGRISWVEWYSFDYAGSNLVFTCNADLVGSNSGHAYEVFLGSFDWQPFWCYISKLGTNQYRLTWPAGGYGSYTVESRTSLASAVWLPIAPTNQWPTSATDWTNTISPGEPACFFRVRAN